MITKNLRRWAYGSILVALLMVTACAQQPFDKETAAGDRMPAASNLHRDHGLAALRAERYKEAVPYFKRILKDMPEDGRARLGLGESFLGQGLLDTALAEFERLGDEAKPALQARSLQGQGIVLLRQGNQEQALRLLEQAIEKDAGLWRSWNALGRIRDASRDHAAARVAYRRAIELNPKVAFLHNNLGFSYFASGEPAYAEASLNRALELDPTLEVASTNLRLALALQGRYAPALSVASPSDRAVVMNNVGYAALLRGDHEKARALFLDAMAADPGFFGEAKRNLAFLDSLGTDRGGQP